MVGNDGFSGFIVVAFLGSCMTLWLDSGTVQYEYVFVEDEERVEFRERVVDGRPRVEMVVPAGVVFDVDVDGFVREFGGCDPSVTVPDVRGEAAIVEGAMKTVFGFRPAEMCTVVFSATEDATGLQFEGGET